MSLRTGWLVGALLVGGLAAQDGPLATVGGQPIHVGDLDVAGQLLQVERERYQILQAALDEAIGERLLKAAAAKAGVSYEAYVEREITSKVTPPNDGVVEAFYEENKLRIGRPLDGVRDQIAAFLLQQALNGRRDRVVSNLRSQAKINILLEPPRAEVDLSGAYRRGPANAPVKIVEFSDFQCPFCKRMQSVLTEVVERYDGKVSWYYKDLPLVSIHSGAKYAAEAARCAGDQGKFWEYRDALFAADKVTDAMHQGVAKELSLDLAKFQGCLSSDKYSKAVEQDLAEAEELGITATPTLMINGIMLSGVRGPADVSAVIDRELQRTE